MWRKESHEGKTNNEPVGTNCALDGQREKPSTMPWMLTSPEPMLNDRFLHLGRGFPWHSALSGAACRSGRGRRRRAQPWCAASAATTWAASRLGLRGADDAGAAGLVSQGGSGLPASAGLTPTD
jgi:hypothetical protein